MVLTSNLTLVECERVLVRSVAAGDLAEEDFIRRRLLLESASGLWSMVDLERGILDRACRRFPREPLRTLDALHLASAMTARRSVPDLALLSLDGRVRQNGAALGFDVLPG
jgi:predicted nucleic acid-binding protein